MSLEPTIDLTLRDAHRRRIAAQLPSLGMVVTGCALSWFTLTALADPLVPFGGALAILVFQVVVFGTAAVLCRRDPVAPRVTPLAVGACLLVGMVWVLVFTTTATVAAMLMFSTVMLFGAAPVILAWGLGPQLVFQGSLTLLWVAVLPLLPKQLPMLELAAALGFSNLFALAATQWAVRGFRAEVLARVTAVDLERQIAASRDAYRALAENVPDFIWATDGEGRWSYVNEALARRCGLAASDMIGRSVAEILTDHPGNPDPMAFIARLAADQSVGQHLLQMATPEGPCWVEAVATLMRGSNGDIVGVQGVSRDVTERHLAEERLRSSEHRFRTFAESMKAGVVIAQPQGLRYVNEAVSIITGYDRDELLRMQVWDLVHPDERALARQNAAARLRGDRVSPRVEYRLATKSGETCWVDVTVTMIDFDGEPAMLGTALDITERKLAEEALRASEARYRGLIESQREIVLRFDAEGRVTFANDAYCDTFGIPREEAIGRDFWPLVHLDDVESLRASVAATMQPPYRTNVETRSRTASGWRWFEWEVSAIRDAQGVVVEGQAAGRDVTERRRAQDDLHASLQELRRSEEKLRLLAQRQVAIREEERKRLSFDLHDDVCQELVGIGILVESAVGGLAQVPPETAAKFTRASGYLGEVVEHLRLLARDLRPMLLRDLGLEDSLRSLAAGFSNEKTAVQAIFSTPIPRLDETVEVTVYRIAQEAIANAIRHAEARHVTVTLTTGRDRLDLEVRDDGRGFELALHEGQAFGLTSMEERAQALAGRFTLWSRCGEGTIVRFECPRRDRLTATTAA